MTPSLEREARRAVWRDQGATVAQADELLAYSASPLPDGPLPVRTYPLPDAAHVFAWERYAAMAREEGAFAVLERVLVQLRFPIETGMSGTADYQAATRRGVLPEATARGLELARPEGLRLFLHSTPAGRVPVIVAEARADFDALVQALTARNEPSLVPPSMGACMIAGYNNWDRVRELRRGWEARSPLTATESGWADAFREIVPRKDLYQDRFMLLSSGPYSSTPAAAASLTEAAWREASVRLRLEHECTHYFMRQAYGVMRKSLLDELVADYMGLVEAVGRFRSDLFLLFMGLESLPRYRKGGRFENYRGVPPLSDGALEILQPVVGRAAETLERLDPSRHGGFDATGKAVVITALCRVGLEGLASGQADDLLDGALREATCSVSLGSSLVRAAG